MMAGRFREYNWHDIVQLIYADAGMKTEGEQRTKGELWCVGGFSPPEHERDTCVRVYSYDKEFQERIREHAGESA
jgi:hypothetical protein